MLAAILALPSFGFGAVVGGAVCFLVGCFTPALGRKIKSYFVTEADKIKADVAKKL